MLKPEPERRGFKRPPRGLADLSVSENLVDRYNCIKSFCQLKTLGNKASKSSFLYYNNGARKHEGFVDFENACSRAKSYVILTSLNYVHFYVRYCWWRQLLWRPGMRICKVQKPCINSTWIAWLMHGFLPVKTWFIIACGTAFYAIIVVYQFKCMALYMHHSQAWRYLISTLYMNVLYMMSIKFLGCLRYNKACLLYLNFSYILCFTDSNIDNTLSLSHMRVLSNCARMNLAEDTRDVPLSLIGLSCNYNLKTCRKDILIMI